MIAGNPNIIAGVSRVTVEVFEISRVESGRVRRYSKPHGFGSGRVRKDSNLTGRVGSPLARGKCPWEVTWGHFIHSRIPPVENGPFRLDFFSTGFFWSSCRQSSRFCSFRALPRGGWCEGVLLYSSRQSVGSSVLRVFVASNACFALDEPLSKRVGGVGLSRKPPNQATFVALHSAESLQRYSRRSCCWQNGIDTARCCRRTIHAAGGRS